MGITIKEIAKLSGFGYGTVVRALSEEPYLVKKETREKILAVAEEHGYIKDIYAQALVSGKTKDIGLLIPAIFVSPFYRDYYMKVISGIMEALDGTGFKLRVMFISSKEEARDIYKETKYLKLRGLIMSPYCQDFIIPEKDIQAMEVPVVVLGRKVKGEKIWSIILDDLRGGYDGTKYLIDKGHTKIGVIRGFRKDIEKRYKGYLKALSEAEIKPIESFILKGDQLEGTGYSLTMELLQKRNRPTALFCLDDEMAYGALRAMQELEMKCPKEMSVLGFDNIEISAYTAPPLTTMNRPVALMGKRATEIILHPEKYKGKHTLKVWPDIMVRKTVAANLKTK